MAWDLKNDRPIYTQLLELMQQKIISGEYLPGSKIPSVRELAAEAAVNPNTMQRAMAELESSGLIITNRTSGRVVTDDTETLSNMRDTIARQSTKEYCDKMVELGFSDANILQIIKEGIKE